MRVSQDVTGVSRASAASASSGLSSTYTCPVHTSREVFGYFQHSSVVKRKVDRSPARRVTVGWFVVATVFPYKDNTRRLDTKAALAGGVTRSPLLSVRDSNFILPSVDLMSEASTISSARPCDIVRPALFRPSKSFRKEEL
ncbi:hypothetical protein RRG08_006360 [Elysia crispata]|uniref:Uncharacterized protein n=1 Tax=Elysia crispata TaxID=231223 RepID=A0AAE0Z9Y8_9GAST|nr:hypothetical protein RRG08_006360 [Elysia crispata]